VEIDRLKNDPSYIESVARREFGMIGPDEIVVKPQRPPDR
jgi:cell division protein FtsB